MFGVEDQRGMHGADMAEIGLMSVQQVKEMPTDAVVISVDLDDTAVMGIVVPIEQHGTQRRDQPIGDVARAGMIMVGRSGKTQPKPKRRYASHPSDEPQQEALPACASLPPAERVETAA